MKHDFLSQLLRNFLVETPYNSVTHLFSFFASRERSVLFGSACVWQSFMLGERLKATGFCNVRYIRHRRHVAVLAEYRGIVYLLDPYLLQLEPIALPRHSALHNIPSVPCLPRYHRGGVSEHLPRIDIARTKLGDKVFLRRMAFDPYSQSCIRTNFFKFDLDDSFTDIPDLRAFARLSFAGEQNTLSIRAVDKTNLRVRSLIYPIALYHGDPEIKEERLVIRTNDERFIPFRDSEAFYHELEPMTESLGCSTHEVISFILEGVKIYEAYAPKIINYSELPEPLVALCSQCTIYEK